MSQSRKTRLAARLKAAREEIGWARRQLAIRGEWCSESNIRAMEEGSRSIPPPFLEWVERLAKFHRSNPPPPDGGRVDND